MDPGATWTLDELTERLQRVLDVAGVDASKANGQIAEAPNARTIRYYTTLGLIDRPAQSGRTAMYNRRHLEQLVAIKRLQARGLVLADIERELVSLDDKKLKALSAIPEGAVEGAVHGPVAKVETRRERAFWSSDVADVAPARDDVTVRAHSAHSAHDAHDAVRVTGIQLSDGVTLAFPAARPVDDDDTKALRAAFAGVLEILRARGLIEPAVKQAMKEGEPK